MGLTVGLSAGVCATRATAQALSRLATLTDAINKKHIRLRAATGHPCLNFHMRVRPELVMEHMYDHLVGVDNACTQPIVVRLCYRNSTVACQTVKVRPHGDKTILLGVVHDQPNFVFDFAEAFAN